MSTGMGTRVWSARAAAPHKRNVMKSTWLTVAQLAAILKLSVVSVHRTYGKEYPVIRIGRMVSFDLEPGASRDPRNGHGHMMAADTREGATRRATGGATGRRGPA